MFVNCSLSLQNLSAELHAIKTLLCFWITPDVAIRDSYKSDVQECIIKWWYDNKLQVIPLKVE